MANAYRDQNNVPTLIASSNVDGFTPVRVYADPTTHRLLVDLPSGTGTVTSASVVSANGFAGTVATATTTPAITLTTTITGILKGNATAISAATDGSDYLSSTTGVTLAQGTAQTIGTTTNRVLKLWATDITVTNAITGSITGNAATVTTNANLTGAVTSVGNATSLGSFSSANLASALTDETGSGAAVFGTNPTIAKPVLNATNPTAQTYSPAGGGTATLDLSLANQHYITMPAGNATIALSNDTNNQCFIVSITQDSVGSRTVTWFTTIRWAGGSAPTLTTVANKRDTFGFIRTGSGTYDGFIVGQNI